MVTWIADSHRWSRDGENTPRADLARLPSRVISADSMQVYRFMDTAQKVTPEEMARVRHHLKHQGPRRAFERAGFRRERARIDDH